MGMISPARRFGFALAALCAIAIAAPAEAGGKRGRPKYENLANGPFYMQIERIVVPKIYANAVQKLFSYTLVVEFADAEARDRAMTIMPKLMDAYIHDLHVLTSRPAAGDKGADPAVAKRYLLQSSQRIMGAEAVKDVLIEQTYVRKTG
jgi:hypothetical protein